MQKGGLVVQSPTDNEHIQINYGAVNGEILINNHGLSRKHIVEGTLASLKRLDLDYVDIIYAHRPDRLTPMEETVRAFNYLIDKGLAFYWGTSMWAADEIAEACGIAKSLGLIGPVVEQPLYNLIDRQKVEAEYQRLYARCGIGLTVFSPLKGGVLTGKYNNAVNEPPKGSRFAESQDGFVKWVNKERYGGDAWIADIQKVEMLQVCPSPNRTASASFFLSLPARTYPSCWLTVYPYFFLPQTVADKLGCKLSHLALAWCLKNENVASVITGASRPEQVVENVEALKVLPKLTADVMEEIETLMDNKPALDPARQG